jgi:hypothetical protein
MNNFALPLVIITWHRMVQKFFLENAGYTFFDLGNYNEQEKYEKMWHMVITCTWKSLMEKEPKLGTLIVCVQTEN